MSTTQSVAAFVCRLMCVSESVCVCACRGKRPNACASGLVGRTGVGSLEALSDQRKIKRAARSDRGDREDREK